MSGMPMTYSPGTIDQCEDLSSHLMYGGWWLFPVPRHPAHRPAGRDGRQPRGVPGLAVAAPDVMGIHRRIRKRGKVIVIDPVRTATGRGSRRMAARRAAAADRPGGWAAVRVGHSRARVAVRPDR